MTPARWLAAVLAVTFLPVLSLVEVPLLQASALPQVIRVGVVDFYAPTPLGAFLGMVPERYAADELSRLLTHSASFRLEVIPSMTMQKAQDAMRWQGADVLHFDRLRALARAVGADRLVVGWIPLFSVDAGGGRGFPFPDDGNGPPTADANIVVRVFDAAEARVVAETRQSAFALGINRLQVAAQVLHVALERVLPALLTLLTAQAP